MIVRGRAGLEVTNRDVGLYPETVAFIEFPGTEDPVTLAVDSARLVPNRLTSRRFTVAFTAPLTVAFTVPLIVRVVLKTVEAREETGALPPFGPANVGVGRTRDDLVAWRK